MKTGYFLYLKKHNPRVYYFIIRNYLAWIKRLQTDKSFIMKKFRKRFGVFPDLEHPRKYNEFVTRILMSEPTPLMQRCADKFEVRSYVEEKNCGELLNDLYGLYDDFDGLIEEWDKLPEKFVIKATHGSSWNYICKDKSSVDLNGLRVLVNHWLKSNFYHAQREKVYRDIQPRIICEKYLEDSSGGLADYKIHCFGGKPAFLHMATGRYSKMLLNTYDLDGNFMNVEFIQGTSDKKVALNPELPLEQMLDYSRKLSSEFNYVRVDFYYVEGRIVIGELTFTPGNGHYAFTEEQDLFFGKYFSTDPIMASVTNKPGKEVLPSSG